MEFIFYFIIILFQVRHLKYKCTVFLQQRRTRDNKTKYSKDQM